MGKYGYNHGDFSWNELATEDPQKAVEFYTKLIGWQVEEMDMPTGKYFVLMSGEEKIGGILVKSEENANAPTAWMPYITVEDVDATAEKVATLGGKVIAPPVDIPVDNGPRLSIIQDPSGATLGIITYSDTPE